MTGTVVTHTTQVGQSGTAANNFTIRTLNDGSLRISRGNAGTEISDVLVIDANGNFSTAPVLGVGQTWQNVTGIRASNVTYTNTTGRPIFVFISYITPAGGIESVSINGVVVGRGSGGTGIANNHYLLVPHGSTYVLTTNGATVLTWAELR